MLKDHGQEEGKEASVSGALWVGTLTLAAVCRKDQGGGQGHQVGGPWSSPGSERDDSIFTEKENSRHTLRRELTCFND